MGADTLWERCRDKALRQREEEVSGSDSPELLPGMSIRSPIVRVILDNLGFKSIGEWQRYWAQENRRLGGKVTLEEERSRDAFIKAALGGSKCDLRKLRGDE